MSDLFNSGMTPRKLRQIYSDGFQGAPINMGDHEALFSEGLVKEGDAIAHLVRDNPGDGKRAYLWRSREKYDKGAFGQESQTTGDCLHGFVLINTYETNGLCKKRLKDMKVGDKVYTHLDNIKTVTRFIERDHDDVMYTITTDVLMQVISATANHQFLVPTSTGFQWIKVEELTLEHSLILYGEVERIAKIKKNHYIGKVYCIDVEDDHSFIADGYSVHNCTSHGCRNSRDTTRSVEIHIKGESEEYYKRGATEPTYGARGHSGQGMSPSLAARFVTQYGWMVRQNYPGCVDLTRYNSSIGSGWGRKGVPKCVRDLCSQHDVGEYLTPRTPDEAMALFQNGYACHSGQNIGFSSTPSKRGIHERKGNWNHDMATVGYDDTKEIWNTRVYLVVNSWGRNGSQWTKWRNDSSLQNILGPPITGMIVVDASVWERYFLGGGSIYFYSDVEGFPSKTLPDYGTTAYL